MSEWCEYERDRIAFGREEVSLCAMDGEVWVNCREVGRCYMGRDDRQPTLFDLREDV